MIYLIHENNKVLEVLDNELNPISFSLNYSITVALFELAKQFPNELLIWCQIEYRHSINYESLNKIFHHEAIIASYSIGDKDYLPKQIGYVDQSIYIKVNKAVTYPTWLMSSDIGGIHSRVLNKVLNRIKKERNFDYFLNSLARLAMPQGLFCYSEPKLILNLEAPIKKNQASQFQLFKFVKQHYKSVWLYYLFLCFAIYEKRFPLLSLLNSLRFRKRNPEFDLNQINIKSSKNLVTRREVDIIIPTLGRKKYLLEVLNDLSKQTLLPKNVIIAEQNPDSESISELDYLKNKDWPFKITHLFLHQTGACNARNLALSKVKSQWVILGDDDNRFNENLIRNLFNSIDKYGVKALSTVYLQPNEKQTYNTSGQTIIFGSGNSIIKTEMLDKISFDIAYEFGYGEDRDFGMQIRNIGEDVLFDANIKITHLKAPIGGFRIKMKQIWDDAFVQPKPSPTISLFNIKYLTEFQLAGYKLLLFLTYYRMQELKNPFNYFKKFQDQWKSSMYWANLLADKHD